MQLVWMSLYIYICVCLTKGFTTSSLLLLSAEKTAILFASSWRQLFCLEMLNSFCFWKLQTVTHSQSSVSKICFFDHLFFIKMPHSGLFFLHFRIFNLVDSKHMFYILICQRLKSNCGHLVSEVKALPTEPQPLSILVHFLPSTSLHRVNTRLMTTTSGLVFILDTQIPEIVPYLFCLNSFVENRFMKNWSPHFSELLKQIVNI